MGTSQPATTVPGHGTLFVAPANTACPATPLTAFSLGGAAPAGWDNVGHTSKDNLPAFKRDGGDATTLDSWLADAINTIYASSNWSLGFNDLQVDANGLNMAFGGSFDSDGGYIVPGSNSGIPKALFLFSTDGTGSLGFYIPNTLVNLGDAPSFDPAKFFELALTASILAAASAQIPAAANGIPAIMKVFKTTLATPAVPTITTALPTAKGAGDWIQLVGTGFGGVTAVTVGGIPASFLYGSDASLLVQIPAGSAGSAPIIVTNATGPSASKAYTRT